MIKMLCSFGRRTWGKNVFGFCKSFASVSIQPNKSTNTGFFSYNKKKQLTHFCLKKKEANLLFCTQINIAINKIYLAISRKSKKLIRVSDSTRIKSAISSQQQLHTHIANAALRIWTYIINSFVCQSQCLSIIITIHKQNTELLIRKETRNIHF